MLEEKRGGGRAEGSQLLMWPIYKMQARTHACIKVLGLVRLVFLVPPSQFAVASSSSYVFI